MRISGNNDANQREARKFLGEEELVITREKYPLEWAINQSAVALTYALESSSRSDGNIEDQINHLEAARAAIDKNVREHKSTYADIVNRLGDVFQSLQSGNVAESLSKCVAYQKEVIDVTYSMGDTQKWAVAQNSLGAAYRKCALSGHFSDEQALLQQAIQCYEEAAKVSTEENNPLFWALIMYNMGIAFYYMGQAEEACQKLREARRGFVTVNHTPHINTVDELIAQMGCTDAEVM